MARPPAYDRTFSFSNFETNNPGQPKPGVQLDTEFDNVSNAIEGTQTSLALIQRDDGALANDSVGEDQLQDDVFEGIVDGLTDEAQAAADAATAAAAAAQTHSTNAQAAASAAIVARDTAQGAAAQAGTSQSIAQQAAVDAEASAQAAEISANEAETAANETDGDVAETQANVELSYRWAEYLAGPVAPAPPLGPGGLPYPEAVDDGMWSSKWWALRARDYSGFTEVDLGTGAGDVWDAYEEWLETNEPPIGNVVVDWNGEVYWLTDPNNPGDPNSWIKVSGIQGPPGPVGPPNELEIGTVTTGAPGSPADATITGTPPLQTLNLTIPQGDPGADSTVPGPPNSLEIGTVTTLAPGAPATATITGTPPAQTLNLGIPQGATGSGGAGAGATPTALIGLTVKPGVATTLIRSDGAPALDQAIAPTWTGQHIFTSTAPNTGTVQLRAATVPRLSWNETGATADNRLWWIDAASEQLRFQTVNDAVNGARDWMLVDRTGVIADSVTFPTKVIHTKSRGVVGDWGILLDANVAAMGFNQPNAAANNRLWAMVVGSEQFSFAAKSDDELTNTNWLVVDRTGATIDLVTFPSGQWRFGAISGVTIPVVPGRIVIGAEAPYVPMISFVNSAAGAHSKKWDQYATTTSLVSRTVDDVDGSVAIWQQVNRTGITVDSIALNATNVIASNNLVASGNGNVIALGGILALKSYNHALTDSNDGYLRLNNSSHYANGVYTPGAFQASTTVIAGTWMRATSGISNYNATAYLAWGPPQTHGTCYVTGPSASGWHGIGIYESSGRNPVFMAHPNGSWGLYDHGDSKWLINREPTTSPASCFSSYKIVSEIGFNVSSSRKLKRETGKPKNTRDICAKLRVILYRLLADPKHEQLGAIAEEVHDICPWISDGKTISYDRFGVLVLAALQEANFFGEAA